MHHETAERLRTALQRRGMKPVELAEQTGIPRSAISQYLAGKYVPKQDKLYLLSRALRVEVLWLMGLSEQMNAENKKVPIPEMINWKKLGKAIMAEKADNNEAVSWNLPLKIMIWPAAEF